MTKYSLTTMDDAQRTLFLVCLTTTRGQKLLDGFQVLHGVTKEFPLISTSFEIEGDFFVLSTGGGLAGTREDVEDIIKISKTYGCVYIDYCDKGSYDFYFKFK